MMIVVLHSLTVFGCFSVSNVDRTSIYSECQIVRVRE